MIINKGKVTHFRIITIHLDNFISAKCGAWHPISKIKKGLELVNKLNNRKIRYAYTLEYGFEAKTNNYTNYTNSLCEVSATKYTLKENVPRLNNSYAKNYGAFYIGNKVRIISENNHFVGIIKSVDTIVIEGNFRYKISACKPSNSHPQSKPFKVNDEVQLINGKKFMKGVVTKVELCKIYNTYNTYHFQISRATLKQLK